MNVEHLIGQIILGSLGGRRKRSHRATRFLTGGGGSFLNASTLLALGGLAWASSRRWGGRTRAHKRSLCRPGSRHPGARRCRRLRRGG